MGAAIVPQLAPITEGEFSYQTALSSLCLQIPYLLRGVRGKLSMGPEMGDLQIVSSSQLPTNLCCFKGLAIRLDST